MPFKGVSKAGILIDMALDLGYIKASGSWFSCGDRNLAQGRANLALAIEEDEALYKELEDYILSHQTPMV